MLTVQQQYRASVDLGRSLAAPGPAEYLIAGRLCDSMPRLGVNLATVPTWPAFETTYGLSTAAYTPELDGGVFEAAVTTATLGIAQRQLASDEPIDLSPETVTAYCLQGLVGGTTIENYPDRRAREIVRDTLSSAITLHERAGTPVDQVEADYLQRVLDGGEFGNWQTSFHALRRRYNNWRGNPAGM